MFRLYCTMRLFHRSKHQTLCSNNNKYFDVFHINIQIETTDKKEKIYRFFFNSLGKCEKADRNEFMFV